MTHSSNNVVREIKAGERFQFGANWERFLGVCNEYRIERAQSATQVVLQTARLDGKSFLDVGSGSGLFSLSARRMGARVTSFDVDPISVSCTLKLKEREGSSDEVWRVVTGSALDTKFLEALGEFDVVYSWGVLHHTGDMWKAIDNVQRLVRTGGTLCLALYNDQGKWSRVWLRVKRLYNRLPRGLKWLVTVPALIRTWGPTFCVDLLSGRPARTWKAYGENRGMSPWRDLIDWVGGLPFEVAKPEAVFDFLTARGFTLTYLKTCAGGIGCNEYTFLRAR